MLVIALFIARLTTEITKMYVFEYKNNVDI